MDSLTSNYDVVMTLLISGILGALGQGIRVWFGLSELIYNKSSLINATFASNIKTGSIFIGFITGICISLLQSHTAGFTLVSAIVIAASGYIATDLTESLFKGRSQSL